MTDCLLTPADCIAIWREINNRAVSSSGAAQDHTGGTPWSGLLRVDRSALQSAEVTRTSEAGEEADARSCCT